MKSPKKLRIQLSIIISITTFTCLLFLWFGSEGIFRVKQGKNLWDNYSQQLTQVTSNLTLVSNHITYTDLIDHFKGDILQPNSIQSPKTEQLRQSIYELKKLEISAVEQQALLTLIQVLDQYERDFLISKQKVASGTILDDKKIQLISDQLSAYKALNILQQATLQRNTHARIENGKILSSIVTFLLFGTVLIPILFIISSFLIYSLTRLAKANQRIEDTQGILSNLVEAVPDAIISIDKNGFITHATNQAATLFGYNNDELHAMPIEQLIPAGQQIKDEAYYQQFSDRFDKPFSVDRKEVQAFTKADLEIPVEISLRFINVNNQPRLVISVRDISTRKEKEFTLLKSQQQLAEAQRIAGFGNWEWVKETQQLICSEQTCHIFRVSPSINKLTLDAFIYRIHPDDRARVRRAFELCIHTQTPFTLEHKVDGSDRIIQLIGEAYLDKLDKSTRLIGTAQDITSKYQTEQRIQQSAVVFENTSEGIIICDKNNKIIAVNKAYSEITGYQEDEALGKDPGFNKSKRHGASYYQTLWQKLEDTGRWKGELWDRRKSGEVFPKWVSISAVTDHNDNLVNYITIFSDITHIKQSEQRLEYLALHDPLTDLPNRMLFTSRLENALQNAQRNAQAVVVLFIDLDRFKEVNDTLGHLVGDTLLQQVAQRLLSCGRNTDTVARIGGDEFTVIIEQLTDQSDAKIITQKILASFKLPFHINEHDLNISVSIGASTYPEDGENVSELVKNADAAMYQAKEAGRNQIAFYNE